MAVRYFIMSPGPEGVFQSPKPSPLTSIYLVLTSGSRIIVLLCPGGGGGGTEVSCRQDREKNQERQVGVRLYSVPKVHSEVGIVTPEALGVTNGHKSPGKERVVFKCFEHPNRGKADERPGGASSPLRAEKRHIRASSVRMAFS